MALKLVRGTAGNVTQETEIYGAQSSSTGATKMHSQKLINFRIDRTPLVMKLKKTIDIADGDAVSAVGSMKKGVLQGVAVRNDETGIVYSYGPVSLFIWGILVTLLGLASIGIVIGVAIAPMGLYLLFKAVQTRKALAMLASSPPVESAATA